MPSIQRPAPPHEDSPWLRHTLARLLACGTMPIAAPLVTALAVADRDAGFAAAHRWARWFLDCFGIDVHVEDANGPHSHPGSVFVLLDQTSLLDGVSGALALPGPFRVIVNVELLLVPGLGLMAAGFGIPIIRQWPAQARRQLEGAVRYLEGGGRVWISIEGRRSKDGRINAFKKGPAVLAIAAQAPIVPMWIEGGRDVLPYGRLSPRPGRIAVKLLPRIETRGLGHADRHDVVQQLRRLAAEQRR
jgi:1-acyl-sn-glycerol-3-phosphate acyltransferase